MDYKKNDRIMIMSMLVKYLLRLYFFYSGINSSYSVGIYVNLKKRLLLTKTNAIGCVIYTGMTR